MKLYNYETNVKYNNGEIVLLLGSNKKELEEHFKDLGVNIGKRSQSKRVVVVPPNYVESQKQLLIKYLKLKKVYIDKGEKEKCQK